MAILTIALTDIIVQEDRQRKTFEEADLQSLRDSISDPRHGLYNPLLVRPHQDKYILVAGERRFRAIKEIGKAYRFGEETIPAGHVPALPLHFQSEFDAIEAELFENVLRVDLSWQEKAEAVAKLHKLRLSQNPKHTAGMTAALVTGAEGYASGGAYERVNTSLFVSEYLTNDEVKKATSLKEGAKIASRIVEEELLNKLRRIKEERKSLPVIDDTPVSLEEEEKSGGDKDLLDLLPPSQPKAPTAIFYQGDFRDHLDKIPDGTVQVVVTDPPYGMGVEKFNDGGSATLKHEYEEKEFEELYQTLIASLDTKCTANAHVYIFCDISFFSAAIEMFSSQWWVRRAPLLWHKGNMGKLADGGPTGFTRTYECIVHAKRGKRPIAEACPDVLTFSPQIADKIHAAQKPVELYAKLISLSALPNEVVFDPFAGSGTIFKAAERTLTKAIGCELSPKFATNIELMLTGEPNF